MRSCRYPHLRDIFPPDFLLPLSAPYRVSTINFRPSYGRNDNRAPDRGRRPARLLRRRLYCPVKPPRLSETMRTRGGTDLSGAYWLGPLLFSSRRRGMPSWRRAYAPRPTRRLPASSLPATGTHCARTRPSKGNWPCTAVGLTPSTASQLSCLPSPTSRSSRTAGDGSPSRYCPLLELH